MGAEDRGYSFEPRGLGYVVEFPESRTTMRVDRISRSSAGVRAEVSVETTLPTIAGHLHQAQLNLTSTTARGTLAKHLAKLSAGMDVHWDSMLEVLCVNVLRAERQGQPFQTVGKLSQIGPADLYLVEGFIPEGKVTVFFGAGGSMKSYTALAIGVAVATGRPIIPTITAKQGSVLYLDWESDQYDLNARVQEIAKGAGLDEPPEIFYRSCAGPLADQVEELAAFVADHDVKLVIVDSVGMALSGGEDSRDANETTIKLFTALRLLQTTALLIDHVSNEAKDRKGGAGRPYGSVYKENLARACYEVRRGKESLDRKTHIGLFNTKRNRGAFRKPLGLAADFSDGMVRFIKEEVSEPDLIATLTLADRIEACLREGAKTVTTIGVEIEEGEAKVRTTLNRGNGTRFTKVGDRWANLSKREDSGKTPVRTETPRRLEVVGDLPF